MRDHNDDALVVTKDLNGTTQGVLALRVEIGIGLIEHHKEWVAEYGPRKADALALAGRQRHATLAYSCRISLGQAEDDVMNAGDLCGSENCL